MKLVLPTRPATALPPRARYSCAFCGKEAVKRKSTGIWTCGGCKRTQTGAFGRTPRALPARAAASYRTPRVAVMRPKCRTMRLGRGFCARTGIRAPWPRFHPRPTRAPPLPCPTRTAGGAYVLATPAAAAIRSNIARLRKVGEEATA